MQMIKFALRSKKKVCQLYVTSYIDIIDMIIVGLTNKNNQKFIYKRILFEE